MASLTPDPTLSGAASPASRPGRKLTASRPSRKLTASRPSPKLTAIDLVGGIFCHICKLVFGNKKEFDSHYLSHDTGTKEITYTCVPCHSSYTSYRSFRGHCYTIHVIKERFKCNNCNKNFSKLSALNEHNDNIHSFKCNKPNCNNRFSSKKELHVHQILHQEDGKPPYQCRTCSQEIENVASCEDHIDQHFIFTYACPFCTDNLTKENASEHLAKHFVDLGILNTDFNDDSETEEISETEEMPEDSSINIVGGIWCCFCKKFFKNPVELDTHFAEEHPDRDVLYTCIICNKKYEKYRLFANHCYWHYSKNRFPCDSCDKTYPRLSLLVAHSEVHKYDKQPNLENEGTEARCRLCKLRLEGAIAAKRHLTVHRRAQFCCPVCTRCYAEKYLLMKHIPTHFEAVLHMCKVCAKVFSAKHRLMEHAKTHTPAAKTFDCNLCGKSFLKPYLLSQHLNIHTGERPFTCPACPKTFASHPNCQKHMRRIHNIDTKMRNKSVVPNQVVAEKNETDEFFRVEEPETPPKIANTKETYVFYEDAILEAISIDSSVVAREAESYESEVKSMSTNSDSLAELTPIDPEDIDKFVTEMLAEAGPVIPHEYGPDFGPEEAPLAHVAPQLVAPPPPLSAWSPPIISKVFSGRFYENFDEPPSSMIDTDMFFKCF